MFHDRKEYEGGGGGEEEEEAEDGEEKEDEAEDEEEEKDVCLLLFRLAAVDFRDREVRAAKRGIGVIKNETGPQDSTLEPVQTAVRRWNHDELASVRSPQREEKSKWWRSVRAKQVLSEWSTPFVSSSVGAL